MINGLCFTVQNLRFNVKGLGLPFWVDLPVRFGLDRKIRKLGYGIKASTSERGEDNLRGIKEDDSKLSRTFDRKQESDCLQCADFAQQREREREMKQVTRPAPSTPTYSWLSRGMWLQKRVRSDEVRSYLPGRHCVCCEIEAPRAHEGAHCVATSSTLSTCFCTFAQKQLNLKTPPAGVPAYSGVTLNVA